MRFWIYERLVTLAFHILAKFLPNLGLEYAIYVQGCGRFTHIIRGDLRFVKRIYGTTGNVIQKRSV